MTKSNLMQHVLGAQWAQLPPALQAHYQDKTNTDLGVLDIDYPRWMQPCLSLLRLVGALLNQRGKAIPTTVHKFMDGSAQRWQRSVRFPNGTTMVFNSHWVYAGGNELIEFVNSFLGLRMALRVAESKLYYEGKYYVIQLGRLSIPLPEWLVLGHTSIVETAIDANHFTMDFRLQHPLFGQIYRYTGKFTTV